MNQDQLEAVLGRAEHRRLIDHAAHQLGDYYKGKKVLITGANGSLGQSLTPTLEASYGAHVLATDLHNMDVTNAEEVNRTIGDHEPDYVFHFAAGKHAPVGEENPTETAATNIDGLKNVIAAAEQLPEKPRLLFASTCKACDPETVYGATKLIGERMAFNYPEGSIARLFNVVQTQGNVFETWAATPEEEPIEVAEACNRYFISLDEACALSLLAATKPHVRYMLDAQLRNMADVAGVLYPTRLKVIIRPRRGDRTTEKYRASNEVDAGSPMPGVRMVCNYSD